MTSGARSSELRQDATGEAGIEPQRLQFDRAVKLGKRLAAPLVSRWSVVCQCRRHLGNAGFKIESHDEEVRMGSPDFAEPALVGRVIAIMLAEVS